MFSFSLIKLVFILSVTSCFQEEVIRVAGEEALELGLLFGTESMEEDEADALCFAHLMLQEFAGGLYISEQDIVSSFRLKSF